MPVIKSAKKKLRQDKKKEFRNQKQKDTLKLLLKNARKTKAVKDILSAVKAADKAAKNHLIHKNKAARIKAKLARLIKRVTKPAIKEAPAETKRPRKQAVKTAAPFSSAA